MFGLASIEFGSRVWEKNSICKECRPRSKIRCRCQYFPNLEIHAEYWKLAWTIPELAKVTKIGIHKGSESVNGMGQFHQSSTLVPETISKRAGHRTNPEITQHAALEIRANNFLRLKLPWTSCVMRYSRAQITNPWIVWSSQQRCRQETSNTLQKSK